MFGKYKALRAELDALRAKLDSVKNDDSQLNTCVQSKLDDVYSILTTVDTRLAHLTDILHISLGLDEKATATDLKRALQYRKQIEEQVGGLVDGIPSPPRALTGR